ncbi:MAG: hypothetical protein CR986_05560 [Ignavibacteriae bacterium]|nr:MAG: hypothetical protein CR986_05560 [Ignavibacteriota bacterium]
MKDRLKNYLYPLLIAILIFISNFLNTEIFNQEIINFTVWFILALFVFATGWATNTTLDWVHGGKVVFSVIVAMVFVSSFLVSFFSNFFSTENLVFENIILYSLRNIFLGSIAFFGMSLSELITKQREIENYKNQDNEKLLREAERKSEIILKEATVEAENIILKANKKASAVIEQKNILQQRLKDFIDIEKEVIKNYEIDKH